MLETPPGAVEGIGREAERSTAALKGGIFRFAQKHLFQLQNLTKTRQEKKGCFQRMW
jgi:hypothetical protein